MKKNKLLPQAILLYNEGKTIAQISNILDVSRPTLIAWKKECKLFNVNWDTNRQQKLLFPKSVSGWLEKQIQTTMKLIETNKENDDYLSRLDKFITMKKKYDGSIDKLGETSRVMEDFAIFVRENSPDDLSLIKNITTAFLQTIAQ